MTQEVDAGCIVEQTMIEFDGTELFQEIRTLQAEATFALIKISHFYPVFERVQRGVPTYYLKELLDSEINVDLSMRKIFKNCVLVIMTNGHLFYLNGFKYILKIFKVDGIN